ncbi:adenylate/guanylate cyclase domain-containing protein [Balneatrix alpica]|uniref:adenylate/guanylate cyclase domain-containing protein n=1 Tax=Balneatrix alpica TaxID=75684 RepID=UPI00273F68A4|nr:adenylate/guanylate cyclase domain-containing protein [Balneatrix alpica]
MVLLTGSSNTTIRFLHRLAIACFIAIAILAPQTTQWSKLDLAIYDFIYSNSKRIISTDTAIIGIDDNSLEKLGPWPWPREVIADTVDTLFDYYKASGVALDILMPDEQPNDAIVAASFNKAIMAQALEIKNPSISKQIGYLSISEESKKCQNNSIYGWIGLSKKLLNPIVNVGHITPAYNIDGKVREYLYFIDDCQYFFPSLALASARLSSHTITIPTSGINFLNFNKSIPIYSLADIVKKKIPPTAISQRFFFIGSLSSGLYDWVPTPTHDRFPGVMLHAIAYQNLISNDYIIGTHLNKAERLAIVITILLIYLLLNINIAILLSLALTTAFMLYIYKSSVFFEVSWLVLSVLFFTATALIKKIAEHVLARRKLESLFSEYIPKQIIPQLINDSHSLTPKLKNVSILFVDIKDYTTLVESSEPSKVVELLNYLWQQCSEIVINHDGVVDKYLGDGFLAFWNAPLELEEHQIQAVNAAIKINELIRSNQFSAHIARLAFQHPIDVGIGIAEGQVMVGVIGSQHRMSYTVIGDAVNIAARLQEISKKESDIICNFTIYSQKYAFQSMGLQYLKGKKHKTEVYRVIKK